MLFHFSPAAGISGQPRLPDLPVKIHLKKYFHHPAFLAGVHGSKLPFVVNNTRFLILPWGNIKCLASKILTVNVRRISEDWTAIYQQPVYLLENFVEKDRFLGTCYKAANWICVGQTKGTSKRGHDHLVHGLIKDVFPYPLRKDFRERLKNGT